MDAGGIPCENDVHQPQEPAANEDTESIDSFGERDAGGSESKRSKSYNIPYSKEMRLKKELTKAVWSHLAVPIDSTCNTTRWVNDWELNVFTTANEHYKYACAQVSRVIAHWKYDDFKNFYVANKPQWMSHEYYDTQESYTHISNLLTFQFQTEENIKLFINKMYAVCEKLIPKRNSIYISGDPSSCKTYFSFMVCTYYLSMGEVENPKRNANFPYNNCPNKRILYWNEPEFMFSSVEDIKKLLGGDLFSVNVKNQSNITLDRTPVIITSNNTDMFQKDVWRDRIFKVQPWQTFPYMKDKSKFPHPLTWETLVDKYVDADTLKRLVTNKDIN